MANYTIDINIKEASKQQKVFAGDNSKDEVKEDVSDTAKGLATFVATQAVKPFLKSAINFASSNVELMTGSSGLQEQVNFAMQTVNDANGILSTTAAGLALGGPVGAAVGAVVGVAQIGVRWAMKDMQLSMNRMVEDRQIAYTRSRLGAQFNSSRRG